MASDLIDEAYGYPDDSPKCNACGVKMMDHLGLLWTCKALLEAQRRIGVLECDLAAALDRLEYQDRVASGETDDEWKLSGGF